MTAEVIIMNKSAVAVAADSAVTIPSPRGDKVYNSANKIFTLSKYEPVCILIYNSTEFTTKPWETVIKEFREKIKDGYGKSLKDYAEEFLKYLSSEVPISKFEENEHISNLAASFGTFVRNGLIERCGANRLVTTEKNIKGEIQKVLNSVLRDIRKNLANVHHPKSMSATNPAQLLSRYSDSIVDGILEAFDPYVLNTGTMHKLVLLFCEYVCSSHLTGTYTGFSIVGFGRDEYYPSAYHFLEEGRIGDCTKIMPLKPSRITTRNESVIRPLAQRDMMESFVEGIDNRHLDYVREAVSTFVEGIPDAVAKYIGGISPAKKGVLTRALRRELKHLDRRLFEYRQEEYVYQILDAVRFLDKQELAMMAESLVSLAALKQKVTLNVESIGGPIDVAVISKNDGFVWISRKHYFDPKLNPFFARNYLRQRVEVER